MEKEYKNLDDLLRDSLNDFQKEPSAGLWKRIISALPPAGNMGRFSSLKIWMGLAILTLILIILLMNYNIKPVENSIVNDTKWTTAATDQDTFNNVNHQKTSVAETVAKSGSEKEKPLTKSTSAIPVKTNAITEDKPVYPADLATTSSKNIDNQESQSTEKTSIGYSKNNKYLIQGYFPFLIKRSFQYPLVDDYSWINQPEPIAFRNNYPDYLLKDAKNTNQDDYGKRNKLVYGIHVVPELIFAGADQTNKGMGIEITGRYLWNDFYVETGLGFNLSDNNSDYKIDYEQYDSIGYYYKVNSFSIDENSGQPLFNTDVEAVFDTVDYSHSEVTRNTYTYLYLPLYAGIELYRFKKITMNLQAGLTYSLLIKSNEPTVEYNNDQATRISIVNETPSRISSNWLMSASVGLQYQFNTNIGLNVEPMLKYYIKPIYERDYKSKNTLGFGMRVGMYFKF
jgi:hypothetical protein